MPGFAVIIPAAGGSSRLGQPKQLVVFEEEPLVRRAARTAIESGASQVIVVVGCAAQEVIQALDGIPVEIIVNPNWQLGLGGSIRHGAEEIRRDVDAVVVTLCDMPRIPPGLLSDLADAVRSGNPPVAAAEYDCHLGPPCAFHSSQFAALRGLNGETGARAIIGMSPKVAMIEFPGGSCDIDTPEDVANLMRGWISSSKCDVERDRIS